MLSNILKTGLAGCLAAATVCATLSGPAQALPLLQTQSIVGGAADRNVTVIDYLGGRRTTPPGVHRKHHPQRGFHKRGGRAYYNGHRGYRHHRRGYRRYNGWWFPMAAFTFGAIIGQGLNQPYPARGLSRAHYDWCYNRYRSYRAYDNTFQPYHGPRRACRSPYWP